MRSVDFSPVLSTLVGAVGTVVLLLGVVACGGSGSKPILSRSGTTSESAPTTATTPPSRHGRGSSVSTGPVHGVLRAENHRPKVNSLWTYRVMVTDAADRPLSGRVDIELRVRGPGGRPRHASHPPCQERTLAGQAHVPGRCGGCALDLPRGRPHAVGVDHARLADQGPKIGRELRRGGLASAHSTVVDLALALPRRSACSKSAFSAA
jgi:hypothetical protein